MKVFVSWSGELSQKIAEKIKKWVEQCIQSAEVFYSPEDIEKGNSWLQKISTELRETNFGIVCLTPDNVTSPWINFEAGALSKQLDSRVATLAIDLNLVDIKGPLSSFQATRFGHDEMYKLLHEINAIQEKPLSDEKLKMSFDAFWPAFADECKDIVEKFNEGKKGKKTSNKIVMEDSVEELLQIVRGLNTTLSLHLKNTGQALNMLLNNSSNDINDVFDNLYGFVSYVLDRFCREVFEENAETQFLIYQFINFVLDMVKDYPVWNHRFRSLISQNDKISYVLRREPVSKKSINDIKRSQVRRK